MLFTTSSLIVLALSLLAIVLSNIRAGASRKELAPGAHRPVCVGVFAVGCFVRLFQLGTLPGGISAEEALVGVQAKALWQMGGFLFDGGLTTQLAQWIGESTGPLLATLTAPFVGIFGMSSWTVRLPLALLSCAAMPAAYGLGNALGGKRAGRWSLAIYALCPYFVLAARLTAGANAAVFLLPIALYAMVRGMEKPAFLYAGTVFMGLNAYAQNMYFFISPAAVLIACTVAAAYGMKKRHALGAAVLGVLVCLPAIMTLWVNLRGGESYKWLGLVQIPVLENFDKADSVAEMLIPGEEADWIRYKLWAVITGGVFQVLTHINISPEMFAPEGLGALYILSVPLMLLGGFALIRDLLEGRKMERRTAFAGMLLTLLGIVSLFWLVMYGSIGVLNTTTGCTSVFDYSALFLFDALLMTAGLCRTERKSSAGIGAIGTLFTACFVILCVYLFGGGYQNSANVYFRGFGEMSVKAEQIQEETGAKVNVTSTVYPHVAPSDAAEFMYLYAIDADMKAVAAQRRATYDMVYAPGIESPDPQQIYIVTQNDVTAWDLSVFEYEEMGEYVLLSPLAE